MDGEKYSAVRTGTRQPSVLDFAQNTIDGVMVGASYSLLGLGFTLMFGVMR